MADLFSALRTTHSGLVANQQALDVVARNIANANTPGYSAKNISFETRVIDGTGRGVDLAALTRTVDEGLLATIRTEASTLGSAQVQNEFLSRVQTLFGTPENDSSLSHIVTKFQAALESLALSPNSALNQTEVVRRGEDLASEFRGLSDSLQTLRKEADQRIGNVVAEVGRLLTDIADLNVKIVREGHLGQDQTTLLDHRDQALDQLSSLIDIRVFPRSDGDIAIFTSGGRTLVDSTAASLRHTPAAQTAATTTYPGGLDGIYLSNPPGTDITSEIRGGELAGLIALRDETLTDLQAGLDELAGNLRDLVNQVHNRGTAFPGAGTLTGTRQFTDPAVETIALGAGQDAAIALFDAGGNQSKATTLQAIMQSAAYGSGAQPADGPWTISEVGAKIEGWLKTNGAPTASVSVAAGTGLDISLGSSSLSLAFRDQATTDPAGGFADVNIAYSAEPGSFAGFSNFFGLNDFFVDGASSKSGVSTTLAVRSDLRTNPHRVSTGSMQWDASIGLSGSYLLSKGDNSVIQELTAAFDQGTSFAAAGGLPAVAVGFSEYAAMLIGKSAVDAAAMEVSSERQTELVETLQHKSDSMRGVNLDQELADLMLYEQAYAASARVMAVVQSMFEALERAAP